MAPKLLLVAALANAWQFNPVNKRPQKLHATTLQEPELSPLVTSLKPSATIEVHALTLQMKAAGETVVSLCVGEPDFAPQREILEAIGEAAMKGLTRYTEVTGTGELRTAIARDLKERKHVEYDPGEIVVANGAKQAVYEALMALCGPGDDVVLPAPYWVSYPSMVEMCGATYTTVSTSIDDGFALTPEQLQAALKPTTKALILCNPSNPTGCLVDEAQQRALLKVLDDHERKTGKKVWVVADEIYEQLNYGTPHKAFAALGPSAWARTVTINGFSKAYAMTGFRLGYLAAPQPVAKACAKIQGQITSCASSLAQAAGVAALNLPSNALDADIAEFKRRRDLVLELLEKAARNGRVAAPPPPEGAFYVFCDVAPCLDLTVDGERVGTSTNFCKLLLKKRKLALVPGDAFGAPTGIRLSYAASEEDLRTALAALDAFANEDCR
jgi:aspartate/glutamate/aspartate-prephenate aminotransferase